MVRSANQEALPAPLSRRERRKLEVRGRMLEAAAELFRERGFNAATVAEICDRADVARKTFFNHFHTKRHVLHELAGASVERLLVEIEESRKRATSTREGLAAFFEHVAQNLSESQPMSREFANELIHSAQESGDHAAHGQRLQAAFGALIEDGVSRGDLSPRHDPELCTEIVMGVYHQLVLNWVHVDGYPIEDKARAAARFLADALAPAADEE